MRTSVLMMYLLSAWIMAVIYDRIEVTMGVRIHVLLCGAIVTMVVGLYKGLHTNNNDAKREEA